jgi:hypothetical protein
MRSVTLAFFLLACTAGSSSTTSTTSPTTDSTVSGTVGTTSFTVVSAIAYDKVVVESEDNGKTTQTLGVELLLSDKPLDCNDGSLSGAALVDIDVVGQPPNPGAYAVIDPNEKSPTTGQAASDFNALDPTCKTLTSKSSKTGNLTLTTVGATLEGTADITFETGRISGAFKAVKCTTPPPLTDATGRIICH